MRSVASVAVSCAGGDERCRRALAAGSERFKAAQRDLSNYLARKFALPLDERAQTLGHLLSVSIFLAFEDSPGVTLISADADAVAAADAALAVDEEMRQADPVDTLDSEDIVAIEQPALTSFVNEQVGATLERYAGSIDVDDVALVFRSVLVEILTLSHAVQPPPGYPLRRSAEPMA